MKYLKCFSTFILAVFFAVCSVTFCYADNSGSGGHVEYSETYFIDLIGKHETFSFLDYNGNDVTVQWQSDGYYFNGLYFPITENAFTNNTLPLAQYLFNQVANHNQLADNAAEWFNKNKANIVDLTSLIPNFGGVISNVLSRSNDMWEYKPQRGGLSDVGKAIDDKIKNGVIKFVNGTLNISKDIMTEIKNKAVVQYYNSIGAYCFYQHNEYQTISNFRTTLLTNWDKIDSSKRLMSSEQFNALFDSNNYDFCSGRDNGFFGLSKKKYTYCYFDEVIMSNGYFNHLCFTDSKLNLVYPFTFNEMYHAPELTPYANDGKTCSFDYLPAFSLIISSTWGNYLEPHPVTDYYSNYLNDWYKSSYSSKKLYAWQYNYSGIAFYNSYFKNSNTRIIIFKTKSDFINYYNSKHSTYINSNAFNEVKEDVNINLDDIKNISSKMDAVIDAINNTDKSDMTADDLDNLIDKVSGKLDNIDNSISDNSEILKQILQELKNNGYKINDNIENNNSFFDKILQEMKIQESLLQQILGVSSDISNEVEMQTYIDEVNSITLTDNIKNEFKNVGNEMKNHFPFSAPWDLQRIYSTLSADESPPKFVFDYSFMYKSWLGGSDDTTHELIIDFKDYQMLSDISKGLLSLLFLYGLIQLTQKFIFKEVG